MTKDERQLIWRVYSLLQIIKDEQKYYVQEEMEKLLTELRKKLEN